MNTPEIPLLVIGCDFRIASSAMREKLVTDPEERGRLYTSIKKTDDTAGLLVLETCNRLEWVVSTREPEWIAGILEAWVLNKWQREFPDTPNLPTPYIYRGKKAVGHMLRVVVGMESLAAGEAQIAGQFQAALKRAQKEKTTSPIINRLGHIAGRIAKSGTKIGYRSNYRQGIHGLVTKYFKKHFDANLSDKIILVAGMGEIGRRTASLIEETFQCKVIPLNRTITAAQQGKWISLAELNQFGTQADALVVATSGSVPVIDEKLLQPHLRGESGKAPLLIMDIGIPRQVTEQLQNHRSVIYRNIDHLMDFSADNGKCICNKQLEEEIQKEFQQFKRFCRGRDMSNLLTGIHSGRLELTETLIPGFVSSQLADLDEQRQKKIEGAMKQFVRDYSNQLFSAFHDTMEKYWSTNGHE
ncbi:MAG: hypothetical protein GY765_13170 [bacterium]|nr:hypothetical protein [bacterium]